MKAHPITWKFTYMNDNWKFNTVTGSESDESSAIKQIWALANKYKNKAVDAFFISKAGLVIPVSTQSGKVKRN